MGSLPQLNGQSRDQGLRLFTLAVAVPALIYAGLHFPGTVKSRALLVGIGGVLLYGNYTAFKKPAWTEPTSSTSL